MDSVAETKARTSHRQIRFRIESFLGFLEGRGCTDLAKLDRDTILAYWKPPQALSGHKTAYASAALHNALNTGDIMRGAFDASASGSAANIAEVYAVAGSGLFLFQTIPQVMKRGEDGTKRAAFVMRKRKDFQIPPLFRVR